MLFPKWSTFLTNHPQRHQLEDKKTKIMSIFHDANTEAEKLLTLASLSQSPSTIILTLNTFNNTITSSFHHSTRHLAFLNEHRLPTINALTGFGAQAIPIQIHSDHLFQKSPLEITMPSTDSIMDTHDKTITELKALPTTPTNNHTIYTSASLPPSIALPLIIEKPTDPWEVLHLTIKTIAKLRPDDDNNWDTANIYEHILHTLWAFCNPTKLGTFSISTAPAPASDTDSMSWAEDLHARDLQPKPTPLSPLPFTQTPPELALDRLTNSLNRFNKAPEESDDEDGGTTDLKKAWKKIGRDFQQAILFASSPDGITTPTDPSDRLLQLVNTKNGATAARLIKRWHNRLDIVIQTGMATNITKCMLTSTPDEFSIDTFSPFFTPPMRAGFQNMTNMELNSLELSQHSRNLTPADIRKMITCTPYIPKSAHELKLQVQNYHAVVSDILTEDSLLTQDIQTALNHIENNEAHYFYLFKEHRYFGVWFLYRLHFKSQSILHQCLRAETIDEIDFGTFSIKEELKQVSTQNIHVTAPSWYLALEREEQHKQQNRNTPPRLDRGRNRPNPFGGNPTNYDDKRVRIDNNNQDNVVALTPGENYAKIVHYKSLQKHEDIAPKINGTFLCNNWHIRGFCFNTCRRAETHTNPPQEIKGKYRAYVTTLRKEAKDFQKSPLRFKSAWARNNEKEATGETKQAIKTD